MRRTIILDFIDECITEKIYKKAREAEKELLPDNFTAYYLPRMCYNYLKLKATR